MGNGEWGIVIFPSEAPRAVHHSLFTIYRFFKLSPESPLASLMDNFPRTGRLEWIGLGPAPRALQDGVIRLGEEVRFADL